MGKKAEERQNFEIAVLVLQFNGFLV